MAVSEAQKKASIKWKKQNYKRIPLDVTPDKYDKIKDYAESNGESVNGFIKRSIDKEMNDSSDVIAENRTNYSWTFAHVCYTDANGEKQKITYILHSDNLEKTKEMYTEELRQNLPLTLPDCKVIRVQVDNPTVAVFSKDWLS